MSDLAGAGSVVFFTTAGDCPGPNFAQNQNEEFAKIWNLHTKKNLMELGRRFFHNCRKLSRAGEDGRWLLLSSENKIKWRKWDKTFTTLNIGGFFTTAGDRLSRAGGDGRGRPEPLRTFVVAETSAVYASINWETEEQRNWPKNNIIALRIFLLKKLLTNVVAFICIACLLVPNNVYPNMKMWKWGSSGILKWKQDVAWD